MPSYKSNKRTEHNEAVFKDICNLITAEFQKELSQAILSAYDRRKELGKNAPQQSQGMQTVEGKTVPKEEKPFR